MIVVGITGGIGSGKTTLCKEWEKLGATVVYADPLAKELMVRDKDVIRQLKKTFGEAVYFPDGSLNKEYLIKEAFENNRVHELNNIVHPALYKEFEAIRKKLKESGEKLLAKEAAILLNKGRPENVDIVVMVISNRELKVSRVQKRDNVNESDVLARINKQPDFSELTDLADFVIENNGTLEEFKQKSRELYFTIIRKDL
ncbi:MAG: dephospho-CoA kinase [Balneolaceae bacterium]